MSDATAENGHTKTRVMVRTAEQAYDAIAESYDEGYTGVMWRAQEDAAFSIMQRDGAMRGRVLDLGCGTGLALRMMEKRGEPKVRGDYTGVDVSFGMLQRARAMHPSHEFIKGDMQYPIAASGQYQSAVSTFGSFNYCKRPVMALRHLRNALAPGGRAWLMVYTARHDNRQAYCLRDSGMLAPRSFYTAEELRALMGGFHDVQVRGFHFAPDLALKAMGKLAYRYFLWEYERWGEAHPDSAYYQIVTGVRLWPPVG
jgi:SAM-dependent methyltransferase